MVPVGPQGCLVHLLNVIVSEYSPIVATPKGIKELTKTIIFKYVASLRELPELLPVIRKVCVLWVYWPCLYAESKHVRHVGIPETLVVKHVTTTRLIMTIINFSFATPIGWTIQIDPCGKHHRFLHGNITPPPIQSIEGFGVNCNNILNTVVQHYAYR